MLSFLTYRTHKRISGIMATPSVMEPPRQPRRPFARRLLELAIPPKIKQPTPNFLDTHNLMFYWELSEISEIVMNSLYLSGCAPVTNENLDSLGVTAVVCALTENEQQRMMYNGGRSVSDDVKMKYVRLNDSDSSDISQHFDDVAKFIDEEILAGGRVLVHCAAGISRSTTLVLAYLMKYRGYDLRAAFNLVKNNRRVVRPNNGFFQKLIDYERSVFGGDDPRIPSVRMVKYGEDEIENNNNNIIADVRLIPDVVLEHARKIF